MQDSAQAGAAPPDETTPQGTRHPHPVSRFSVTCSFVLGS